MYNKNKKGFTVAEILVVLAVVGVISALAIPNLYKYTNAANIKTSLKSGYSTLSNAYNMEFSLKTGPSTKNDADKMMDAINNNINVKFYLTCTNGSDCEVTTSKPKAGVWAINENNIAFKVIEGNSTCAEKSTIVSATSTSGALNSTCLGVIIDAGCIAKNMNEAKCYEIEDNKEKILGNDFSQTQIKVFVSSKGVSQGNPESVAAGLIISE